MKKKREAQRRNVSYLEMGRGGGLFPTWEQNAGPGEEGCGLMLERILAYIH